MKERKITIILTSIIAISFIVLFLFQYKIFYSGKPNFPQMIDEVVRFSVENKWDKAEKTLVKVEEKWNSSQSLIAIKYADQDYSLLNIAFAKLRASVNAKNTHGVEQEGKACILIFKNITSISPNP